MRPLTVLVIDEAWLVLLQLHLPDRLKIVATASFIGAQIDTLARYIPLHRLRRQYLLLGEMLVVRNADRRHSSRAYWRFYARARVAPDEGKGRIELHGAHSTE